MRIVASCSVIILLITISCNPLKITAAYIDKSYDFNKVKTFAWLPDTDTSSNDFDNKNIRHSFRNYISHKLESAGSY